MLAYLLDENISYVVAEQLIRKNPRIRVQSVYHWHSGVYVGQEDRRLLQAAAQEQFTLVTYDLKTIPRLLSEMAADRKTHSGVILVNGASIRSDDFGGLIRALLAHWERYSEEEWSNRVSYLEAA